MHSISASDKIGEYDITVSDGVDEAGERKTQILLMRKSFDFGMQPSFLSCGVGDWRAFITIVQRLRDELSQHDLHAK